MNTCLIISGGEFNTLPEDTEFNYIIACDKGYEYSKALNLIPDVIIGDYDSLSLDDINADLNKRGLSGIDILRFPSHKDDSDTMLAIKHAIEKGFDDILIVCALGGRFDHAFANIQSMAYCADRGVSCRIVGDRNRLYILKNGSKTFRTGEDCSLSVFSLSDESTGVTIKGALYEAGNITLTNTFPLGLSNIRTGSFATVSVENGTLLIVESRMDA